MPSSAPSTTVTTYMNYIDGDWVPSASGRTFENRNPANTDDLIGLFQKSTADDAKRAVDAAARAYEDWRLVPAPKRGEILFRAAQIIADRKEQFARDMTREMGKVLAETRGDVQEAVDMSFFLAGEGRRLHGQTTPSELRNKFAMSTRVPLGVCGIVTPWNFPMAIPCWKMMPALVAGNCVVLKPASDAPHCAVLLVELLEEAGLPPGVVNLVTGPGETAGMALVESPDVPVVSFTGNGRTGTRIAEVAARRLKRVSLELGGKNGIVVLADADLDLAVDGVVWSAFGTTGQRCTAASRLIVVNAVADALLARLVERTRALRLGDGLDPGTDVGPLVNAAAVEKVERYVAIGREEGGEVLLGGRRPADERLAHGHFLEPTIIDRVDPMSRLGQEEVFGPVLSVIRVPDYAAAVAALNGVPFGLSSSVYTRDTNAAFRAMRDFRTGIVYVNAGTIGAETHLPFGGMKQTGNGHREAGHAALDTYTEWKAIYVDYSGRLQRAQIDNQPT
jgi:alpha-ketoglutaric semialdehyde dehydrogenase